MAKMPKKGYYAGLYTLAEQAMNKEEALAAFKQYTLSQRPTNPWVYAARHTAYALGIAAKDKRQTQLKAYLVSLPDPGYPVTYREFTHYIARHHLDDFKLYTSEALRGALLEDPTLPCPKVFNALLETAPKSKSATMLTEPFSPPPDGVSARAEADLNKFPIPDLDPHPPSALKTELTIGDPHGNAIKLWYVLLREKVLTNIKKSDYARLLAIYKTPVEKLTEKDLDEFKSILKKARTHPSAVSLVRIAGDVWCDRGENDALTAFVLKQLDTLGIPLKAIAGNHDIAFRGACKTPTKERPVFEFGESHLKEGQDRSMHNLKTLLEKFPKYSDEIAECIKNYYASSIKLLDCTVASDGKSINLYTHAPIGLNTIREIAKKLGVDFKSSTPYELKESIDQINAEVEKKGGITAIYKPLFAMQDEQSKLSVECRALLEKMCEMLKIHTESTDTAEYLVECINVATRSADEPLKSELTTLSDEFAELQGTIKKLNDDIPLDPFYKIIWNREYSDLERPPVLGTEVYSVYYFHGHDHRDEFFSKRHTVSLDDEFGKGSMMSGNYKIVYSEVDSRPRLEKTVKATEDPPLKVAAPTLELSPATPVRPTRKAVLFPDDYSLDDPDSPPKSPDMTGSDKGDDLSGPQGHPGSPLKVC